MIPEWYCRNCKRDFGYVGSYYDERDGKHCPMCDTLLIPIEESSHIKFMGMKYKI